MAGSGAGLASLVGGGLWVWKPDFGRIATGT